MTKTISAFIIDELEEGEKTNEFLINKFMRTNYNSVQKLFMSSFSVGKKVDSVRHELDVLTIKGLIKRVAERKAGRAKIITYRLVEYSEYALNQVQ